MQALSGNTNDQKAFAEVTRHHIQCLKAAQQCRYFVADAALYCIFRLIRTPAPV
jgi:hypothetical protein